MKKWFLLLLNFLIGSLVILKGYTQPIQPLAESYVTLFESPDPLSIYAYSPGIARLANGKLIATIDIKTHGVEKLPDVYWKRPGREVFSQGRIYTSDDGGNTWQHRADFPFVHARPFIAGENLYIIGQAEDLLIIRSDDGGETWSSPAKLTEGQFWHQAPCNVHYANGCVYLVMERRVTFDISTWPVGELAPVIMRGRVGDDLTQRANWTFASELSFRQVLPQVETTARILTAVILPPTATARHSAGWRRMWCSSPTPTTSGTIPTARPSTCGCAPTPAAPAMPRLPKSLNKATSPARAR